MYAWVHQSGRMWYGYMYSLLLLFICTVVKIINICFRWGNRTSYYGDMFIKDNEEVNEQICGIYRKGEKEVIIYILYILYSTVLYKMWLCQYFYVEKCFHVLWYLYFLLTILHLRSCNTIGLWHVNQYLQASVGRKIRRVIKRAHKSSEVLQKEHLGRI